MPRRRRLYPFLADGIVPLWGLRETKAPPVLDGPAGPRRLARGGMALALTRDLINTPANHMRPGDMARQARDLAGVHGAEVEVIGGEALAAGFPLIHAVGRAAGEGANAPRLIDLHWGQTGPSAPQTTLVGKGISLIRAA